MEKSIKFGLIILLLGCLADMPYGYFQMVRFLGMIGFGYIAFLEKEKGNESFFIFWIVSALLINPFLKVSLGRTIWNLVDIAWAFLLIISVFHKPDNPNQREN
jgi:hypothetical protein